MTKFLDFLKFNKKSEKNSSDEKKHSLIDSMSDEQILSSEPTWKDDDYEDYYYRLLEIKEKREKERKRKLRRINWAIRGLVTVTVAVLVLVFAPKVNAANKIYIPTENKVTLYNSSGEPIGEYYDIETWYQDAFGSDHGQLYFGDGIKEPVWLSALVSNSDERADIIQNHTDAIEQVFTSNITPLLTTTGALPDGVGGYSSVNGKHYVSVDNVESLWNYYQLAYDSWFNTSAYVKELEELGLTSNLGASGEDKEWDKIVQSLTKDDGSSADSIKDTINAHNELVDSEPNILIRSVAELIWWCGSVLDSMFTKANLTTAYVVINADGDNPFHFTLEDNNVYGIAGASIYVAFRGLCLALIFVFTTYFLMKLALGTEARQRAEVKEVLGTVLVMMGFIYFFPYIANYIVQEGGAIKEFVAGKMGEYASVPNVGSEVQSLSDWFRSQYNTSNTYNIPMALCYLAYQGATIIYIGEYVGLSIAALLLFGVAPVVFLMATRDKGLMNKWFMTFLWNILTPLFDTLMLMVVVILCSQNLSTHGDFVKGIILVIALWNIIPARKAVLAMMGGANMGIASGIGGLGLLAGTMAGGAKRLGERLSGKSSGGSEGGSSKGGIFENLSNAKIAGALAEGEDGKGGSTNKGLEFGTLNEVGGSSSRSSGIAGVSDIVGSETSGSRESYVGRQLNDGSEGSGSGGEGSSTTVINGGSSVSESGGSSSSEDMDVSSGGYIGGYMGSYTDGLDGTGADTMYSEADTARLDNLSEMEATRGHIEELESGIKDNKVRLEEITANPGAVGSEYEQLAKDYGTLAETSLALDAANNTYNSILSSKSATADEVNQARSEKSELETKLEKTKADISAKETNLGLRSGNGYQTLNDNSKGDSTVYSRNQAHLQQIASSSQTQVATLRKAIAKQEADLTKAKHTYSHQQSIESNYAQRDRATGGKGTTFDSAGQMRTMRNLDAIKKANINYKNFDTGDNMSILTQSEKADFYRQRARVALGSKVAHGTLKAATTGAAMATGMAMAGATMVGGPDVMADMAIKSHDVIKGAGTLGVGVADKAVDIGSAIGDYGRTNRNVNNLTNRTASRNTTSRTQPNRQRTFTDTSNAATTSNEVDTVANLHNLARRGRADQENK